MSLPSSTSYQAEIMRYLHGRSSGVLRDEEMGVTRHIWLALGQRAGCHLASVSAALSELEKKGSLISEMGRLRGGGRARVALLLVEEPPIGSTEFKGWRGFGEGADEDDDPGRYPTAEEVARELLRLALEAAQVPTTDIEAARHHIECLQEEIQNWVEVADELATHEAELAQEVAALRALPPAQMPQEPRKRYRAVNRLKRQLRAARRDLDVQRVALAAARQRADYYQGFVGALESLLEEATEKLRAALDANDEFARDNRHLMEKQEEWAKIIHREAGWKRRYEEMRAERDEAVRKADILAGLAGMSFREQLNELMDPGIIEHVNRMMGREAPDAEAS